MNKLLESFDSEPYEVTYKRVDNERQYIFDNYRVMVYKEGKKLGPTAAKIVLGQKGTGKAYKKVVGSFKNPLKVLTTVIKIIDDFVDTDYGRLFNGFDIQLPKQATDKQVNLVRKLLRKKLNKRHAIVNSDYSFNSDKHIWVVKKGYRPEDVFVGTETPPGTFDGVSVEDLKPVEPKPVVKPKPEPTVEPEPVEPTPDPEPEPEDPLADEKSMLVSLEVMKTLLRNADKSTLGIYMGLIPGWKNRAKTIGAMAQVSDMEDLIQYYMDLFDQPKQHEYDEEYVLEHLKKQFVIISDQRKEHAIRASKAIIKFRQAKTGKEYAEAMDEMSIVFRTIKRTTSDVYVEQLTPYMDGNEVDTFVNNYRMAPWEFDNNLDPKDYDVHSKGEALLKEIGVTGGVDTKKRQMLFKSFGSIPRSAPMSKTELVRNLYEDVMRDYEKHLREKYERDPSAENERLYMNFLDKGSKLAPTDQFVNAVLDFYDTGKLPDRVSTVGGKIFSAMERITSESASTDKSIIIDYINKMCSIEHQMPALTALNTISRPVQDSVKRGGMTMDEYAENVQKVVNLCQGKLDGIRFWRDPSRDRANALVGRRDVVINVGKSLTKGILWHEMGHIIEGSNILIQRAAQQEMIRRYNVAKPPKIRKLRDITGIQDYRDNEVSVTNWALAPYESKIYGPSYDKVEATELVSMGLQYLVDGALGVLIKDKGFLNFVFGVLAILQGK